MSQFVLASASSFVVVGVTKLIKAAAGAGANGAHQLTTQCESEELLVRVGNFSFFFFSYFRTPRERIIFTLA